LCLYNIYLKHKTVKLKMAVLKTKLKK